MAANFKLQQVFLPHVALVHFAIYWWILVQIVVYGYEWMSKVIFRAVIDGIPETT